MNLGSRIRFDTWRCVENTTLPFIKSQKELMNGLIAIIENYDSFFRNFNNYFQWQTSSDRFLGS